MYPSFRLSHPVVGVIAGTPNIAAIEQQLPADLAFLVLPVDPVRVALRTLDDVCFSHRSSSNKALLPTPVGALSPLRGSRHRPGAAELGR